MGYTIRGFESHPLRQDKKGRFLDGMGPFFLAAALLSPRRFLFFYQLLELMVSASELTA